MNMSNDRLGQKHGCFGCGAKFYDLNRAEVVCPRCGSNQVDAPKGTDMAAIAAKVLASSVTETDEPGDGYGPVADEMDLFFGIRLLTPPPENQGWR
jgi:uncharacterized protein (TIGR02300 family)